MSKCRPWGKSVSIDLYGCNPKTTIDPDGLKKIIAEMIKAIDMIAHGPCYVDRFGEGKLLGYSAMQFIKTSSVTVHLDEVNSRAFIDIFSCKQFSSDGAVAVAQKYFSAKEYKVTELVR
ncbi:MAG: S-adenosylmethionine decarboxylase [Parcubacteria group bacterium]